MLSQLSIRNILLIDKLDLEFADGLNVLTGETGAGKSVLLDSLGFVLGWRGRADLVRQGAEQGEVQAIFDISRDHSVHQILADAAITLEDEPLVIRRVVNSDGRKRGFINDRAVSTELMRQIGDQLVESHGQHDDKGLLDEKSHRPMLDEYAGIDLSPMKSAYKDWTASKRELEQFENDQHDAERDADYIRHSVDELKALAVEIGEIETLSEKRRLMQKGEKLAGEINDLMQILGQDGAGAPLANALRRSETLSTQLEGELDVALGALENAYDQLAIAETEIAKLAQALEFDPKALEETEDRLYAIRAAERKYQKSADELPELLAHYEARLENLGDQGAHGEKLKKIVEENFNKVKMVSNKLHQQRAQAAKSLDQDVAKELEPLKLERAIFLTEITQQDYSSAGEDDVRFMVQTNPGAPAGRLSKIASGGELSRFLLALKISLHHDQNRTLIFDEIDRGVGGQTADAVGRRLRKLAESQQLIIVTHSPQVAAQGQRQFLVDKVQSGSSTQTRVSRLGSESRTHEIARMISGDQVSEEALAAAKKLLETIDD